MALDTAPIAEVVTPDVAATVAETEETSLADHEAQFTRGGTPAASDDGEEETAGADRDTSGRFKHRAASQAATADDVTQINALTKELREKERVWAKDHPDEAQDSPRIRSLKRQIRALSPEPIKAEPERRPAPVVTVPIVKADGFPTPKPREEEIGTKYQSYEAFLDARDDWQEARRTWQTDQQHAAQQRAEAEGAMADLARTHNTRLIAFARTKPDFSTVTAGIMQTVLPPVLLNAIATDDNGPAFVYYLGQHPEVLDEFVFDTDGKPLTDAHVATVQRRLKQHAQAAQTGSAAVARPVTQPPKPPNPVRTGPIRTADDPPGDESSLAEHEKAFGPKSRR